ncbi:MAG: hypothetical protein QXN23_05560 [Candidatus Caldarchaeum sp.]
MAGRRAISLVIAALVVTVVFLGIVSASLAMLYTLQGASSEAVKREAERAMEAFFMIYWINGTHVRLVNNHSSVSIYLRYWITSDTSGASVIGPLNPVDYSVEPGQTKVVQAADYPRNPSRVYKVVSERGSVFEVNDPPADPQSIIQYAPVEVAVRPGYTGRLTSFFINTGPEFGGGVVSIQCVHIYYVDGNAYYPCTVWGLTFSPSASVTVPSGGYGAVRVDASIPVMGAGSSLGAYFVRFRLVSSAFTREYVVRVHLGDFSVSAPSPLTVTLNRAACIRSAVVTVSVTGLYTGAIAIRTLNPVPQLNVWSDPNMLQPTALNTPVIYVERIWTGPSGFATNTLTLVFRDGLGVDKTTSLVVVHRGVTAINIPC